MSRRHGDGGMQWGSEGEEGRQLSVAFREVVIIGILRHRGRNEGVVAHMRRAIQHGATTCAREVLTEAFDPEESLVLIESECATVVHGFDTHWEGLYPRCVKAGIGPGRGRP